MSTTPAPTRIADDALACIVHLTGRYRARITRDAALLRRAQELRFEVFNRELHEGLPESWARGYDEDAFDAVCDHLIVDLPETGEVVGTYRMQPAGAACDPPGLYTAAEFHLEGLADCLPSAVETGRACIRREHRNTRVLQLLWQGLGSYMRVSGARYLFGCCSLTSRDPEDGLATARFLAAHGHLHPERSVTPRAGWECFPPGAAASPGPVAASVPPLFASYLRIGTRIVGEPALDRVFGTIDFLALLDLADLPEPARRRFLA